MGQRQSCAQTQQQDLEYYVIRLTPVQSVLLYGYTMAKTTLTWRDTIANGVMLMLDCCFLFGMLMFLFENKQGD